MSKIDLQDLKDFIKLAYCDLSQADEKDKPAILARIKQMEDEFNERVVDEWKPLNLDLELIAEGLKKVFEEQIDLTNAKVVSEP